MVLYKEYKGKYVHWAAKGTRGRGQPTGKIVNLSDRKTQVWYPYDPKTGKQLPKDVTLSYERVQPTKKQPRKRRESLGFGFPSF